MKPTYVYKNVTLGIAENAKFDDIQRSDYDNKTTAYVPMMLGHFDKDGADVVTCEDFYMKPSRHWEVTGLWPDAHKRYAANEVSVAAIEKWLTDRANDGYPHVFGVNLWHNAVFVLNVAADGVYWWNYSTEKGHYREAAYVSNGETIKDGKVMVFHNAHDAAVFCMARNENKILKLDAALKKHQAEIDATYAKGNEYVAMLQKSATTAEKKDPNAWWAMLSPEQKAEMMAKNS
jgi:hypothetical protein